MSTIAPTILTNNITFFRQFATVYSTFAQRIQIDICDGKFVPIPTVSETEIELVNPDAITYDLHMMVQNPSEHLDRILELHPSLCIFHAECSENLLPIFEKLKAANIKTGVAILKTTFPGKIKSYIEAADHVLIFAGQIGKQGSKADMMQLEKVSLIREINPNAEIGWDGGANLENIRAIAHNGIDIINVGSTLSRSQNPSETYKTLDAEINKNGVLI